MPQITKQLAEQFGYELPDNYEAPKEELFFTPDSEPDIADGIDINDLSDEDVAAMLSQLLEAEEQN